MIYFVQPSGGGPIKIGCTNHVNRRRRQLERHYGVSLVILATMEGDEVTEREIHERFSHLRLDRYVPRGKQPEQFRPTHELLDFIGRCPPIDTDPDKVEVLIPVGFDPSLSTTTISRPMASMAKAIARGEGISVPELLSRMLEKPLGVAYAKMIQQSLGNG